MNERLPFNALVLLRKEKEKMRETARPRLKKYLFGNSMQIGFSDSHKQTCKLHLNCNKTAHSIMTLQKIDLVETTNKDFPQKAMRVMKDILIFALDFAGGES